MQEGGGTRPLCCVSRCVGICLALKDTTKLIKHYLIWIFKKYRELKWKCWKVFSCTEQLVFICLFSNVVNSFIQNSHNNRCFIKRFCLMEQLQAMIQGFKVAFAWRSLSIFHFIHPTCVYRASDRFFNQTYQAGVVPFREVIWRDCFLHGPRHCWYCPLRLHALENPGSRDGQGSPFLVLLSSLGTRKTALARPFDLAPGKHKWV